MNYYKKQLSKVVIPEDFEYSPQFKFKSVGGDTNWMDLNTDSVEALREWLNENYPPQPKFINLEDVPDKKSEL